MWRVDFGGYAAAMASTALVVIDMLNTYEHEDAEALTRSVRRVLPNIRDLVERAGGHSIFYETPLEYMLRQQAIERAEIVAAGECLR